MNDAEEVIEVPEEEIAKIVQFKPDVIRSIVISNFTNSKTKISDDAVLLLNELLRILVVEISKRAIKQAKNEEVPTVTVNQLEIILHQIMLDFP